MNDCNAAFLRGRRQRVATIDACDYVIEMIGPARPLSDDENAAFLAAVEAGIADADAGRTIPYEEIRRWLLSWGTMDELPPPECK